YSLNPSARQLASAAGVLAGRRANTPTSQPASEIRIVDADGRDVPEGEPGELLARGPCTTRGHYREPERNALVFTPEGYFRSGVLARRDPEGNVVVSGRPGGPRNARHDH
ncbi:hypothetical protein AB0C89_37965, partial [Streptomyces sp. NPDC048491]